MGLEQHEEQELSL